MFFFPNKMWIRYYNKARQMLQSTTVHASYAVYVLTKNACLPKDMDPLKAISSYYTNPISNCVSMCPV